jgi:8-oxo-dGTP pyrophosphatase MutT (NUDIX family)
MKSIWKFSGIISFWLLFPALFFYMRLNSRTRVIIKAEGKILLVKPWLGSGVWDLPGGGLHLKEEPKAGALREVYEETGIELKKSELKSLGSLNMFKSSKIYCYLAELKPKPPVKKQFVELIDIRWVNIDNVSKYPVHKYSQACLDLWQKHKQA